jgi:hypothetical protein
VFGPPRSLFSPPILAPPFDRDSFDLDPTGKKFVVNTVLHPASDKNPAGKVEFGFTVVDVEAFYRDMSAQGVLFSIPPTKQDFGGLLARVRRFRRYTLHRGRKGGIEPIILGRATQVLSVNACG